MSDSAVAQCTHDVLDSLLTEAASVLAPRCRLLPDGDTDTDPVPGSANGADEVNSEREWGRDRVARKAVHLPYIGHDASHSR